MFGTIEITVRMDKVLHCLHHWSHQFRRSFHSFAKRYAECGIDVGDIKVVAYVALLKWTEYKPSETKPYAYELVKHWDDKKWEPIAIQALVQSCMPDKAEQFKLAKDVIRKTVVLFGNNSKYYGEVATVADAQNLEVNGRVNSEYHKFALEFVFFIFTIHITDESNKKILSCKITSYGLCGSSAKF